MNKKRILVVDDDITTLRLLKIGRLMTRAALVGITKAAEEEDVSTHTLSDWCHRRFRKDYFDLREKAVEQRKAFEAERHLEMAAEAMALEPKIGQRIMENVDEIPVRDLAGAHRNMATSAGIHTDKFRDLRGEGNHLTIEHRNPAEIVRALVAKGAGDLISPELRKHVDVTILEEEAANAES